MASGYLAFVLNAREHTYVCRKEIMREAITTHLSCDGDAHRLVAKATFSRLHSRLISIVEPVLSWEANTRCVVFKIQAELGDGGTYVSEETLEWLDDDGELVNEDRHLYVNAEPLVAVSRALDADMTEVSIEVFDQLSELLPSLYAQKRVEDFYGTPQRVPLWAVGFGLLSDLAMDGRILGFDGDPVYVKDVDGITAYTIHTYGLDGLINGNVFVVLVEETGRAGVVGNGDSRWFDAETIEDAIFAFEGGRY